MNQPGQRENKSLYTGVSEMLTYAIGLWDYISETISILYDVCFIFLPCVWWPKVLQISEGPVRI